MVATMSMVSVLVGLARRLVLVVLVRAVHVSATAVCHPALIVILLIRTVAIATRPTIVMARVATWLVIVATLLRYGGVRIGILLGRVVVALRVVVLMAISAAAG
jgi:hypothetical protein